MSKCMRCGEQGAHFVPPSFGMTGFFMCDPTDRPQPSRTPEHYSLPCTVCRELIRPGDHFVVVSPFAFRHAACELTPSDSSSPVPDGVSPTPARDPKSGSGAVDEKDPSPAYTGSVPVAPRLDIPRAAGEHTN